MHLSLFFGRVPVMPPLTPAEHSGHGGAASSAPVGSTAKKNIGPAVEQKCVIPAEQRNIKDVRSTQHFPRRLPVSMAVTSGLSL